MADRITIEVRGLEELKREMRKLSDAVATRLARNSTMAGARVIARYARQNAPVYSGPPRVREGEILPPGRLKRSIKARRDPDWRQKRGTVQSFANASIWYAHFLEHGTKFVAARPYLRPAADEHGSEARDKMISNLANGIDRELAKRPTPEDPGEEAEVII